MKKFELASPEWIAAIKLLLAEAAQDNPPEIRLSISETFTGVPSHLDKHGSGAIAWHCVMTGPDVYFEETVKPDADFIHIADYDYLLPLARLVFTAASLAAWESYTQEGIRLGKIIRRGDSSQLPSSITDKFVLIHNGLAVHTL